MLFIEVLQGKIEPAAQLIPYQPEIGPGSPIGPRNVS